jgi:hypothetical protein
MNKVPIGVGNVQAQQSFLKKNEAFLLEYQELHALLEKVFLRRLAISEPNDEPDKVRTDAEIAAIETKNMVDFTVFYLGRSAADDFVELLMLAGNARGIGAYKILRGMYERVVTAAFIAANPEEVRPFLSHVSIEKDKLLRRLQELKPGLVDERTPEQAKQFETDLQEAKEFVSSSMCKKCGQPITTEAWTRRSLEEMALKSDPGLAQSYAYCYLLPTFHSHATALGLEARLRQTETGYTFAETSEKEAQNAVLYGHGVILRLLKLQNTYFKLALDGEVEARWQAFPRVWAGQSSGASEADKQ